MLMSPKIVLIIGNGFDVDLGLKTSYSHFIDSRALHDVRFQPIFARMMHEYRQKRWIDIEESLKEVSTKPTLHHSKTEILNTHRILRELLMLYLNQLSYDNLQKNCSAIKVLSTVLKDGEADIFNFNYTDLREIARQCGLHSEFLYTSIHGKLADESIILGFEDEVNVKDPDLCSLIKSHSPYYKSANINQKLQEADEVIFFGHSLGSTDYHYFRNFFLDQVRAQNQDRFVSKRIRIFTYDENSRLQILLQIRNMNACKTSMLYDLNDFRIYRTSQDMAEIDAYCEDLLERIHEPVFV